MIINKRYLYICAIAGYFLLAAHAHAEYVLPYPSFMPGNKIYRLTRLTDAAKGYWYFGNIAQTKYHLALADKYLVEAKTLFEYKQYLLATDAIKRSDGQVDDIFLYIQRAASEGKDVRLLASTIFDAMSVHTKVITAMQSQLPEEFIWRPEKSSETELPIRSILLLAISTREKLQQDLKRFIVVSNP